MKATLCIKVLLVCRAFFLVSGRFTLQDLTKNKLSRVKRAWSYPPVKEAETRPGGAFTPHEILKINSDNPAAQVYKLENSAENNGIFNIENKGGDGVINLLQPLDREQKANYNLVALALDTSGNLVEDPVDIEVIVQDLNDNQPVFVTSSLVGSVQEDQKSGHVFMKLQATDDDSSYDNNNVLRFSSDGDESPAGPTRFNVAENGEISVIGQLDAEGEPTITIPVKVQDGYPGMGYTTRAKVTVTVLDANDHAPVFEENPYRVDVGELHALNVNFLEIAATDTDKGLNSEVSFRIINGDPNKNFKINSKPNAAGKSIGEISLQRELDYETTRRYVLTVQGYNKDATNANDPAFMSTTDVEVTVLDENEPPVFVNQPYAGSVDENKGAPITVGRVTAKDDDFQGTQTITYTIENTDGWFTIDESGEVATAVALDREADPVDQATNQYILHIRATDNGTPPKSSVADMVITINDVNDNPPEPASDWIFTICEVPVNNTIGTISVEDKDGPNNGSPFTFRSALQATFQTEKATDNSAIVVVLPDTTFDIDKQDKYEEFITISDNPVSGPSKSTTALLTVKICRCDENNRCLAAVTKPAGFAFAYIIAIVAAILIILIIVLAVVAYKRRQEVEMEKQKLFPDDDDDVRENLQAYHDEGGGEEDNDAYDMAALQPLPPGAPARIDEKPQQAQPQPRFARDMPPDTDIGEYIDDAKKQADNDPTAPPFDSLLVFDYEGQGSDAGSLSSLNSGTSDGSQDYNYLNNWGPRFQKLADMYGGGEDD